MKVLASIVLLAVQETGNLRWPVGPADGPAPLRATYGQLEGKGTSANLHLGLDIMAPAGEPVCAIEAGTVLKVRRNSIENSAVLIESGSVTDRAFLYLHLKGGPAILVKVNDPVNVGTPLGFIASTNKTGDTHLHLSRVEKGYKSHTLAGVDELSSINPLTLLKRPAPGDNTTPGDQTQPVIVLMANGKALGIRPDDQNPINATSTTDLPRDVIIHAYDPVPSGHRVAPYELQLTVTSITGTQVFPPLTLDGPLGMVNHRALFNMDAPHPSSGSTKNGEYDYYFILTNAGSPPATANCWTPKPGDYKLHVTVRDVKGNAATPIDQDVHIP